MQRRCALGVFRQCCLFFALSGNLFEIAIFWALPRYAREENAIFLLFRASRGGQIGHFRVFRASRGYFTLGAAGPPPISRERAALIGCSERFLFHSAFRSSVLCCFSASSIAIGVACECARVLRKMAQARLPYPNTIIPPFAARRRPRGRRPPRGGVKRSAKRGAAPPRRPAAARATPRGERRDYSIRVGEPCLSHFSHNCYEFSERNH